MIERGIVTVILLLAAVVIVRHIYMAAKGRSRCNCGCGKPRFDAKREVRK